MKWKLLLESRDTWAPLMSPRSLGRFCLDTSCFIDLRHDRPDMLRLVEERISGYVELVKTDLVDIELKQEYNTPIADSFEVSVGFVELMGVFVLDDSRLDHAVCASDSDIELISDVQRVLKPGTTNPGPHDNRDARHLATALRYGCDAFVTNDLNILKRGPQVAEKWGTQVVNPASALQIVDTHKKKMRIHAERTQQ